MTTPTFDITPFLDRDEDQHFDRKSLHEGRLVPRCPATGGLCATRWRSTGRPSPMPRAACSSWGWRMTAPSPAMTCLPAGESEAPAATRPKAVGSRRWGHGGGAVGSGGGVKAVEAVGSRRWGQDDFITIFFLFPLDSQLLHTPSDGKFSVPPQSGHSPSLLPPQVRGEGEALLGLGRIRAASPLASPHCTACSGGLLVQGGATRSDKEIPAMRTASDHQNWLAM